LEELKENDKLKGNRIGLFGGTFNPIHVGHLQAAGNVQKSFALNKICLIPSALPPHKATEDVVDAEDRMEMIRLAIPPLANFLVSDVELSRSGPSYTIDTVIHFKASLHPETRLFLIMGIDAFLEINTWKSYRKLLRLIPVIAMARPGIRNHSGRSGWKIFEKYLISSISPDYMFSVPQGCYFHPENQPIFLFSGNPRDVSSTKIRNLIKTGGSIKDMVSETVEEYIKAKGLYQ
jgi:nicotinate-nucleotide adenylyltransferase